MFTFNDFLKRNGFNPQIVRLLRHDERGHAAWQRGKRQAFGCFASFQLKTRTPFARTKLSCHFLSGPPAADGAATALFVGMLRVLDRWDWDDQRMPILFDKQEYERERGVQGLEAYDLEWVDMRWIMASNMLGLLPAKRASGGGGKPIWRMGMAEIHC